MNFRRFVWAWAHYIVCLGFCCFVEPKPLWLGVWGVVAVVVVAYYPLRAMVLDMRRQEAKARVWYAK